MAKYIDPKTKNKDAFHSKQLEKLLDPTTVVRKSDRVKAQAMRDIESKKHRKRSS